MDELDPTEAGKAVFRDQLGRRVSAGQGVKFQVLRVSDHHLRKRGSNRCCRWIAVNL